MNEFLADENVPKSVVEAMRNCGYDLLWVRDYHRGMEDEKIICLSISQDRIILTFDEDI